MKKIQKRRISILLTLFIASSFLMVLTYFPTVVAGPDIPTESEYNSWHWGVDVGDELYFGAEVIMKNMSSGEVVAMFRDIWIYNISSIENVTMEWLGFHEFSVVNSTRCYYDPDTMDLLAWTSPDEYAIFNFNESDPIKHRYRAGFSGIPQILPLNNSALELDILAPIINQTMYAPLSTMIFNAFDDYEYNLGANSLRFDNSSDGYYAYGEYYGNNGTLKYSEISILANMGDPMMINMTFQRVFDYDITDEVQWDLSVGESVYYDYYEGSNGVGEAYDLKLTITNITDYIVPTPFNSVDLEEDIPMVFQVVFADLYVWNGTGYELEETEFVMGASNNFYPMLFGGGTPPEFLMIMPTTATVEDLEFMWNEDKLRIWGAPLDNVAYNDNTELEFIISNSTGSEYIRGLVDKTTGLFKSLLALMGEIIYYELKDMTLVDWALEPGDTLHYKINENDYEDRVIRATIVAHYHYFANMTLLELDSGGLFTIPSDQPELQFFSVVLADFDIWNATSESWEFDEDEMVLGMANIYWPLSPLAFSMSYGFPILFPMGVIASDFSAFFDVYSSVYDDISYGTNYVTMTNTTLNRQLRLHFDSTSGITTYLGGWTRQPGSAPDDWSYTSVYPLIVEDPSLGVSEIDIQSVLVSDIEISVGFNTTSSFEYLYALYSFNPVNISLPNGTALCYFDQITTHPSMISGNITLTITLPLSINLATTHLYLFAWNVSGSSTWEIAPPEAYEINGTTNSIIVQYPAFSADSLIFALSYESLLPGPLTLTSDATSPDIDGNFTLTWTTSLDADNYSVYLYSGYINSINGSLNLLADEITDLNLELTGYTDGTYYFIVVSHNYYGDTLSNCIQINVTLSSTTPTSGIPGYHLAFILLSMLSITLILIKSKFKDYHN